MSLDDMNFLRGNSGQVFIPEHLCDFLTWAEDFRTAEIFSSWFLA